MRPILVGIGGAYSGAGKTTYASLILRKFKGWGAIKYTRTPFYSYITDDFKILSQKGKDTKRLLDSGAEKVLWVRSPYDGLSETLQTALDSLSRMEGVIIEGNSAIEVLKPDIVIFVSGPDKEKSKISAKKILDIADVVIFEKDPPPDAPEGAKKFCKDDHEGFLKYIISLIRLI
jgi:molybdopterin-guanine dinucleotide biosynthesis protein